MKKLVLILSCFISLFINGQIGNENISYSAGNFFMRGNRPVTKEHIIDGSPYIDGDRFNKVIIKDYSKDVQSLRYNAYEDEMELKIGDEIFYANKINNLKIQFPELKKVYQCLSYMYDGKSKSGYLIILAEGRKATLYKREKVELLKGEKSTNGFIKDANDYYAKEKTLYLISKNNQLYKFPKNVNEAAEFFSKDKEDIESFAKANKINFNKEASLIKLTEYINQN